MKKKKIEGLIVRFRKGTFFEKKEKIFVLIYLDICKGKSIIMTPDKNKEIKEKIEAKIAKLELSEEIKAHGNLPKNPILGKIKDTLLDIKTKEFAAEEAHCVPLFNPLS